MKSYARPRSCYGFLELLGLLTLLFTLPLPARGQGCTGDFPGFPVDNRSTGPYKSWCERHGGIFNPGGPSCTPGPNWCPEERPTPKQRAMALIAEGDRLLKNGKPDEALLKYQEAKNLDPDNSEVLGRITAAQAKIDEKKAEEEAEAAAKAAAEAAAELNNKCAYAELEDKVQCFCDALKKYPNNPSLKINCDMFQKLEDRRHEETKDKILSDLASDIKAERNSNSGIGFGPIGGVATNGPLDFAPVNGARPKAELGFADPRLATPRISSSTSAGELRLKLKQINVPPPIPPEVALIRFGELAPGDKTSKRVLLGLDVGVATLEVTGKIGGIALLFANLILVTGNEVIEAEDAADVYLTKQDDTYERALRYLKDPSTRLRFSVIVRTLKEGKPLSENSSIDMVRTAKALLDPKLGNSGTRITWDALWSPEAKNAMLTRATIELGGEILGQASSEIAKKVLLARDPAVQAAQAYLKTARSVRKVTTDPDAAQAIGEAIRESQGIIAKSYRQANQAGKIAKAGTSIFSQWAAEEQLEKRTKEKPD